MILDKCFATRLFGIGWPDDSHVYEIAGVWFERLIGVDKCIIIKFACTMEFEALVNLDVYYSRVWRE